MDILNYFPDEMKRELLLHIEEKTHNCLEEIRIRVDRPICLKFQNTIKETMYRAKTEDILTIMERITENSIYSYQRQICEGFITIKGGHRVGICR